MNLIGLSNDYNQTTLSSQIFTFFIFFIYKKFYFLTCSYNFCFYELLDLYIREEIYINFSNKYKSF